MTIAVILILAAAFVIGALPLLVESARRPVDELRRRLAPGQFTTLSGGVTHYSWDGPTKGDVAVCIHGITTPSYILDPLAEGLVHMGFRVLRYDLYGRGFSDSVDGPQDAAFHLKQLRELLEDQGVEGGITLVGYSMGGQIAAAFAAEEAHRVQRMLLVATAGLGNTPAGAARFSRDTPWIGDRIMLLIGGMSLRATAYAQGWEGSAIPDIKDRQADDTRYRGFLSSVLASMRGILQWDAAEAHRQIAQSNVPVLAVWGKKDPVVPISGVGRLSEVDRNARQVVVEDADHGIVHTHVPQIIEAFQQLIRDGK